MRKIKPLFSFLLFNPIWIFLAFILIFPSSLRMVRFLYTPLITEQAFFYSLKPKSNIYHLTADLLEQGVLQNPRLFLLLGYCKGAVDTLKAGEYHLSIGTTPIECLDKMKEGRVLLHRLTIVEGWTVQHLLEHLQEDKRFKNDITEDFLKSLKDSRSYSQTNSLEGLFFPESYDYPRATLASHILKHAFDLMHQQLSSEWDKRQSNLPWKSPYEALIAASLVEKETSIPKERAKIAAIIIKRIQKNMPLQIDASVIYGLGKDYTGQLKKSDLKRDMPYNSYTRLGLPPTPIAIPSLASIHAVLHPIKTTALYFVTSGEDGHVFSDTLTEHNRAIASYRLKKIKFNKDA
jgi:UPF0755 protein